MNERDIRDVADYVTDLLETKHYSEREKYIYEKAISLMTKELLFKLNDYGIQR